MRGALLLLLAFVLPCPAQNEPQPAPYTLHVFEDLVQLPVLVLDRAHNSKLGLTPADFSLSLDSGPAFHPTHLHMAGSEPLSITLLLDASAPAQAPFLRSLQQQAALLPFGPRDRLTVLAFDCNLIRPIQNQPATGNLLQQSITAALANPSLHAASCPHPLALWDAVADAASLTGTLPGRRILLVVSSGQDRNSARSWETARRYAGSLGFTVFGIRNIASTTFSSEDPFSLLCGGTGGLTVSISPDAFLANLQRIVSLIRNRYILEFPRPANGTTGLHHLDATVADSRLLVRASGFSAPLLDPGALANPTLTPDATPRPVVGPRRPMDPR